MSDAPKAGTKLQDATTGVEAIVVKPPSDPGLEIRAGEGVALGKRYTCATCNAEVLVTKAGNGELACHGATMAIAQPKTLPSSD
jgi:hypothetical protein